MQLQRNALGRLVLTTVIGEHAVGIDHLEHGRVAGAQGDAEQMSVGRVRVNAELQSILRLAPVIDALRMRWSERAGTVLWCGPNSRTTPSLVTTTAVLPTEAATAPVARWAARWSIQRPFWLKSSVVVSPGPRRSDAGHG